MTEYDFELDESRDLASLDFGGKTEEEVKGNIKFVEENLWAKLERVGKKYSESSCS